MALTGAVAYHSASVLDGAPIVVLLTGPSANVKTGPMIQSWILRADVQPMDAARSGDDYSICGDCRYRRDRDDGTRACYVNLAWAPRGVWKAWKRGEYTASRDAVLARAPLRLGAYGDPAVVPFIVWQRLLAISAAAGHRSWTGYTHQWHTCDPRFKTICMASVDTQAETDAATRAGWRTFRVRSVSDTLRPGEIICPASDEAGHRVTCLQCRLCMGTQKAAKSIAIYAHGPRAGFAEAARQERLW